MYRPVHSRRREYAHELLKRTGYDSGGLVGGDRGIQPDSIGEQEPAVPQIISKPVPPPIVSRRKLGRKVMRKLRP